MTENRFLTAVCTVSLVASGAVAFAACGSDEDAAVGVEVTDPWARATADGATTGAVYVTLKSEAGDSLVDASVDATIAATVEIHESMVSQTHGTGPDDGMATMRPVDAVDLPAGTTVSLEPGGYHIMLIGLVEPLRDGETFTITLSFATAGDIAAEVEVRT